MAHLFTYESVHETPDGGRCMAFYNATGTTTVIGTVVALTTANQFIVATAGCTNPFGVVTEEVENGELCWPAFDGTANVIINGGCSGGDWLGMSNSVDGSGEAFDGSQVVLGQATRAAPVGQAFILCDLQIQPAAVAVLSQSPINVRTYGASGTAEQVADGAMNSLANQTLLTCAASAPFSAGCVGNVISVAGAGAAGVNLSATIATVLSTSQVTLSVPCQTTVANAYVAFGPDDAPAFQAAFNAAIAHSTAGETPCLGVYIPPPETRYIFGSSVVIGEVGTRHDGLRVFAEPATQILYAGPPAAGPIHVLNIVYADIANIWLNGNSPADRLGGGAAYGIWFDDDPASSSAYITTHGLSIGGFADGIRIGNDPLAVGGTALNALYDTMITNCDYGIRVLGINSDGLNIYNLMTFLNRIADIRVDGSRNIHVVGGTDYAETAATVDCIYLWVNSQGGGGFTLQDMRIETKKQLFLIGPDTLAQNTDASTFLAHFENVVVLNNVTQCDQNAYAPDAPTCVGHFATSGVLQIESCKFGARDAYIRFAGIGDDFDVTCSIRNLEFRDSGTYEGRYYFGPKTPGAFIRATSDGNLTGSRAGLTVIMDAVNMLGLLSEPEPGATRHVRNQSRWYSDKDVTTAVAGDETPHGYHLLRDERKEYLADAAFADPDSRFTLGAGWGAGATVTDVTGDDLRFQFTVTCGAVPAANPTVTVAFCDGNGDHSRSFPNVPIVMSKLQSTDDAACIAATTTDAPTKLQDVLTFNSTPTNGKKYTFVVMVQPI